MDILISGASIAGPALAHWLNHYGFSTTIVERTPHLRGGGYAVDFRGDVHLGVLAKMGILDEIRRRQTSAVDLTYIDADGNNLATMPSCIFSGDVEILRGDLAQVLYEATRSSTEYRFGDSIKSLSQGTDGVDVTFDSGLTRRFDLVIGADGLHSNVRRLAFGDERKFVKDLGLYVSIFSVPTADRTGILYSVPGKTASLYAAGPGANPIASLYFTAPETSPAATFDYRDVDAQKALVASTFTGAGWQCDALVEAMYDADDFYFDSTNQVIMDRWATGRVALIGDAGYGAGPGGNGTGTAVVAAYVLASELAGANGDYATAFGNYERILRGYVAGGQKQASGGNDFLAPATWKKIKQRNQFFNVLKYLPIKGLIKHMATKTATAIDLPDYNLKPVDHVVSCTLDGVSSS